jgi:hypothetical protein
MMISKMNKTTTNAKPELKPILLPSFISKVNLTSLFLSVLLAYAEEHKTYRLMN